MTPLLALAESPHRYGVWMAAVASGAVLAMVERRVSDRYRAWLLLISLALAGYVTTHLSPFTFHGGDHFMEGVLLMGGALLILSGYTAAAIAHKACDRIKKGSRP